MTQQPLPSQACSFQGLRDKIISNVGGGAMIHFSHITQLAPQSTIELLTALMVLASLGAVCSAVRADSTYASEGPCELLKNRLIVGATQRVSIPAMPPQNWEVAASETPDHCCCWHNTSTQMWTA